MPGAAVPRRRAGSALEGSDGFRLRDDVGLGCIQDIRDACLGRQAELRHIECEQPEVIVMRAMPMGGLRTVVTGIAEIVYGHPERGSRLGGAAVFTEALVGRRHVVNGPVSE